MKYVRTKKALTKERIVESIVHWSSYMLDNGMVTAEELDSMLSEGIFKRAVGAIKRGVSSTKDALKSAKDSVITKIHDTFKTNDGVKKMLLAMNEIIKSGKDLKGTHLGVSTDKGDFGVTDFALIDKKRKLLLVFDGKKAGMQGLTLNDFRKFIIDNKVKKIANFIDSVMCAFTPAKVAESVIAESNAIDKYIDSNNLSKEDALKPENMKAFRKVSHKNTEDIKAAIEKHFSAADKGNDTKKASKKQTVKPAAKPANQKKDSADYSKDSANQSKDVKNDVKKDQQQKQEPSKEGVKNSAAAKPKDVLTVLDNKLNDVIAAEKGQIIWFNYGPSKASVKLDRADADVFAL